MFYDFDSCSQLTFISRLFLIRISDLLYGRHIVIPILSIILQLKGHFFVIIFFVFFIFYHFFSVFFILLLTIYLLIFFILFRSFFIFIFLFVLFFTLFTFIHLLTLDRFFFINIIKAIDIKMLWCYIGLRIVLSDNWWELIAIFTVRY